MAEARKTLMFKVVERTVRTTEEVETVILELDKNEAEAIAYYLWRSNLNAGASTSPIPPYGSLVAAGRRVHTALREAGVRSL